MTKTRLQISLDHDLGLTKWDGSPAPNGNNVINDIEELVHETAFKPPIMLVHAGNVTGAPKMEQGIEAIWREVFRREENTHPE